MSVYTTVTAADLAAFLIDYPVGALLAQRGIADGVENSNYFVDTERGRYVLTLFERLAAEALPPYLALMTHFARHGIPCPAPLVDGQGRSLRQLNGRPAVLVPCLPGRWTAQPTLADCAAVGAMLGRLHRAAGDFPLRWPNPRGVAWRRDTAATLQSLLSADERQLLAAGLAADRDLASVLPAGMVHADLFRDNVLFTAPGQIGGVIDFYFAGYDSFLFDVAVTVNDWCSRPDGGLDEAATLALLGAYDAERPFLAAERAAWGAALQAAALRFWLSRLADAHSPRAGETVTRRDPDEYRRILEQRRAAGDALPWPA